MPKRPKKLPAAAPCWERQTDKLDFQWRHVCSNLLPKWPSPASIVERYGARLPMPLAKESLATISRQQFARLCDKRLKIHHCQRQALRSTTHLQQSAFQSTIVLQPVCRAQETWCLQPGAQQHSRRRIAEVTAD